jgi:hypothetical protein
MPAKMSRDEIHAFLDEKPGWITLTTLGRDGYPHSIPIGYFRLGEEVYLGCRAGSQKLKNIERNPRVSLSLEAGRSMGDIKGIMIQGDAHIYTEPADLLRLAREAARLRGVPESELPSEPRPGAAYIGVTPRKVISWDYSREG